MIVYLVQAAGEITGALGYGGLLASPEETQ